ncbi:pre-mRNA-splicing factor Slu7 [Trichogramma pretiosum]|uniref:pre-mRNA-splicing factor Slu7 n=1 Tax=Trichogramma pretiosum TaxID=7493 RepID=UPI0006C9D35B|nr:pre-mRNA-splicing factor Slu7 [Trichogramma pretiosum]
MASHSSGTPVSLILKNASAASAVEEDEPRKKSREDWRKAKELEEARKAGTAPAAVDEEGRDINPHIPQYISSTPWYFGASGPTLKHQRPQPEKQKEFSRLDQWYNRGQSNKVANKYRKGACENCGAMGHKRKDCFERPRKVIAKYSNTNIAPDEYNQPNLALDYDGKRDRWAGYDPSEHQSIIEEFRQVEEEKKKMKAEKLNSKDEEEKEEDDSDEDEDKYVDEVDMPGTKVDSKQRITVRNLRIREDTAKYLRNLDPNSAYYDPKTRSMRDNPYAGTDREVDYKGENAARFSGDTAEHAKAQIFSWDASEKGINVHLLAEPTKIELLKKEYDKNKDELKNEARHSIIDTYGGKEHLDAPPRELLLAQTEEYVEYSRTGNIIKGQEKSVIRSRYEEDVYTNNHTSVWGSYWHAGKWGYKCCYAFIKNSYCCGAAGKEAAAAAAQLTSSNNAQEEKAQKEVEKLEPTSEQKEKSADESSDKESSSESSDDKRTVTEKKSQKSKRKNKKRKQKEKKKNKSKHKDKLAEAIEKEEKNIKAAEELLKLDERKRPYNSMYSVKELTEEEKEAYQMKRMREEDPMANFMSK